MADSILITISDDIDHNAKLIAIEDFTYPISSLSNQLYVTLDRSKNIDRIGDLNAIRTHAEKLSQHPNYDFSNPAAESICISRIRIKLILNGRFNLDYDFRIISITMPN